MSAGGIWLSQSLSVSLVVVEVERSRCCGESWRLSNVLRAEQGNNGPKRVVGCARACVPDCLNQMRKPEASLTHFNDSPTRESECKCASTRFSCPSPTMSSLRLLAPRASLSLHSQQLQHRLLIPSIRHASTSPPPKPRVLEKPERFNPPSHPSRIRSKPRFYGPALSEHERQAQKTRRYPHMMPPEGSFMHWFLTDRTVHLYITLVPPVHISHNRL